MAISRSFYHTFLALSIGALLPACLPNEKNQTIQISSPNGDYVFKFNPSSQDETTNYTVSYLGREIIGKSGLGLRFKDDTRIGIAPKIVSQETSEVNTRWNPVYGERSEYPDVYQETLITLTESDFAFELRVRAYNEGVAFRYELGNSEGSIMIEEENTEFALDEKATTWTSLRAQSEIRTMPLSQLSDSAAVERPLLAQLSDSLFVAIGEAGLVDYARMKLVPTADKPGTLLANLASEAQSEHTLTTPWRWVMAGRTVGEILENNYLLLNLNEPNKIEDTSWIRPGKVIREVTLTTQGGMACVDFAVEHNLQFIEFDAGWYGNEYDEASDATTVTVDPKRSDGPLELQKVIDYAKSKNIGVILYVNRRALEKQLNEVLPLLQSWGVQGVKYGFVNVGSQQWTNWLHNAVRKAADHQLMIDVHDEYRPTGYSRTYPNLMTQEGIRGDEERPANDMVLKTLFTRMIAGAGDQTNCYFAPRVRTMGSHASQLAKAVCIYSPWQFLYWYDRPLGSPGKKGGAGSSEDFIQEVPELAFYDDLPTVWDDTKVIDGYPGKYAVIARKSGDNWFVGVLTGTTDYQASFSLDFLDEGVSYEATIYSDEPLSSSITNVSIEKIEVSSQTQFEQAVAEQNGLAMILSPIR
ncbi:MAG: glycoside hydrolase family 97 N-terminal domain-containing protein [Bacteroidota bacterium]